MLKTEKLSLMILINSGFAGARHYLSDTFFDKEE